MKLPKMPWTVGREGAILDAHGNQVAEVHTAYDGPVTRATRHLVAASPAMLDALKTVRTLMGEIDGDAGPVGTIVAELDAAIAAAHGKKYEPA